MANFQTHLTVAAVASTALAISGIFANVLGVTLAILCAVIGTIGGLLPDIDLEHSTPAKYGFSIVSLFASTLIVILYANNYESDRLVLDSLIVWAISFMVIRFGIIETFSRLTVHRGMVHSVPYMAVFSLLLVYATFYGLHLSAFISWVFGLFLFFGAFIHLLLDEIYSVNAFGLKLKKSAGTALKFIEFKKIWHYVALYAVLTLLWIAAPPYQEVASLLKRFL